MPRVLLCLTFAVALTGCADPPPPLQIDDAPRATTWTSVATGLARSCALTAGTPYCWGFRLPAECDPDSCAVDPTPSPVSTDLTFTDVSVGGGLACGITAAEELWCWGEGLTAGLGDGVTSASAVPVRLPFESPVIAVSAGSKHACALTDDGVAWCWGEGTYQLGDGMDTPGVRIFTTPQPVVTTLRFTSITAGRTQTCAVATNAQGWCWGSGNGTLGAGQHIPASTPQLVAGGHLWKSISAGEALTCGVTTQSRGYCWGDVDVDELTPLARLGNGQVEGSSAPVAISGNLTLTSISVGALHTCAVTTSGDGYCWGSNGFGELGIGVAGGQSTVPQLVAGRLEFRAISANGVSCGVSVNENVYCWGSTIAGQLGNGVSELGRRNVPTPLAEPTIQPETMSLFPTSARRE